MKLVLQVAAGVFLGMLTIFGVYTLAQKWEAHVYAQRLAEQQRLEAEARQAAMSHAIKRLQDLTPKTLTSLCGSPLEDRVRNAEAYSEEHGEYRSKITQITLEATRLVGRRIFFAMTIIILGSFLGSP